MILIIDNYDSFTYNLYQYVGSINPDIRVVRNDEVTVNEISKIKPSHIIISPGPGFPKDAGISVEAAKVLGEHIPILGVCLGHQAIGEAFGGKIVHADSLMHGKSSVIKINNGCGIFAGLPDRITVGRYHSLIVERSSLPSELEIIAETEEGEIMAVRHRRHHIYGVQFHPESVLTPDGMTILSNFLSI